MFPIHRTKTLAFAAALTLALAPVALRAEEPKVDTVVATVNGTVITVGHLLAAKAALPPQYQALPDETLFKGMIDQLIDQTLLEQSVAGKLTLRDELSIENERRGYVANAALATVIKSAVTDAEIQKAYDARIASFVPATEYKAAHILVADEAKAKELMTQLEGGADFASLARENSTDTGSGANGGDLGWFGLGMMVKPFEEAVVAATPGKVTGPVKSDFGWHLILVGETRPTAPPTLDALREELAAGIEKAAVDAHIKSLTDAAKIERPGDTLDPAIISRTDILP